MLQFISLVGNQVLSVLNPILSLCESQVRPDRIVLLTTTSRRIVDTAELIKDYLTEEKGYLEEEISIRAVSSLLVPDNSGNVPPHQLISGMPREHKVMFNLAGGMNFHVAACTSSLIGEDCIYLYPESTGLHVYSMTKGGIESHQVLPLPKPIDVLALQKIPYHVESQPLRPFFASALKKAGIRLPGGSLQHVRAGGVLFDCVWNSGNEMRFVTCIHSSAKQPKSRQDMLAEERALLDMAAGRWRLNDLFHRRIGVITNHQSTAERLRAESRGKLDVIPYFYHDSGDAAFQCAMKGFFDTPETPMTIRAGAADIPAEGYTTGRSLNNPPVERLYCPLGKEILPTLLAVWSHNAREAHFIYTPTEPSVMKLAQEIIEHRDLLPVERVAFHPMGMDGTEILDLEAPTPGRVEVNITPGMKNAAGLLTLWAGLHKAHVFSIETGTQKLTDIATAKGLMLKGPDPSELLALQGHRIADYGINTSIEIRKKTKMVKGRTVRTPSPYKIKFEMLLEAVRRLCSDADLFDEFPWLKNRVDLGGMTLWHEGSRIHITDSSGTAVDIYSGKGRWFEELIGYALAESGADDVRVRLRMAWDENTEQYLKEKYSANEHLIFRSDIDVVARFAGRYCMVSCKALLPGLPEDVSRTTAEARGMAVPFGRFTVPLVAYLKYTGEPFKDNDVWVFGVHTFTDKVTMKALLDQAFKERRSTSA